MSDFIPLLTDLIKVTDPFRAIISHILIKKTDNGDVSAVAQAKDASIVIRATAKNQINDFQNVACLGSLPYLKQILDSSYAKDAFAADLQFDLANDGKSTFLKVITFGAKKARIEYQATNPFLNKLSKVKNLPGDLPVGFIMSAQVGEDFEEMAKIHAASAKSTLSDIFSLVYSPTEQAVLAKFGNTSHRSQVVLAVDSVVAESTVEVSGLFSTSKFKSLLRLLASDSTIVAFYDKAMKIEAESPQAVYQITVMGNVINN